MPLAGHFLARIAETTGKKPLTLSAGAVAAMQEYPWPGNVRELQNAMERASVLSDGGEITESDLPVRMSGSALPTPQTPILPSADGFSLPGMLRDIERQQITEALRRSGWVRSRAAELLGMKRTTLLARMNSLGITDPSQEEG